MIADFHHYIPPAAIMMAGSFLLALCHKNNYLNIFLTLFIPILTLVHIWNLNTNPPSYEIAFLGFALKPIYFHSYSLIFGTIFCIAAIMGGCFSLANKQRFEIIPSYIYAGSALGVVFSGDMITLFIYWEIMAIASAIIIFMSRQSHAYQAALRYVYIHLLGGIILMAGIILLLLLTNHSNYIMLSEYINDTGTFDLWHLAAWLILIGILINAATPPFSAWLTDAYPESSPFGGVFLSAFTTKTAVFLLLTLFPGSTLFLYIGLIMIFYGIIYALLENDLRRILSYSIISQIGFMITGIGIGTTLALHGVASHAFCHILYKALLFMSTGSVLYMTGKSKCSELGGLSRSMKITTLCMIIGTLSMSAFPFTVSFISKSLISSAAGKEHLMWVWLLLLAGSAGVFLCALMIKIPWFRPAKNYQGVPPKDPPLTMQLAMLGLALLCILPAIPEFTPLTIYKLLPSPVTYQTYTASHILFQLQILFFSGLAFLIAKPLLKQTNTISLDFDWLYRSIGWKLLMYCKKHIATGYHHIKQFNANITRYITELICSTHGPEGVFARNWPIGTTLTWTIALLAVYLLLYYL